MGMGDLLGFFAHPPEYVVHYILEALGKTPQMENRFHLWQDITVTGLAA
jgi:hypothetical protein